MRLKTLFMIPAYNLGFLAIQLSLLSLMMLALVLPLSQAEEGSDIPQGSGCSETEAIAAAQAHPAVVKWCSATPNGVGHGCSFRARRPSRLNANERDEVDLAWVISASVIHSFDEAGRPRFMPEGTIFAYVSEACKVASIISGMRSTALQQELQVP